MTPTIEHPNQPAQDLTVRGALPAGLSGQLVSIGHDFGNRHGVVQSIQLHGGRITRYRALRSDIVASNIIIFGGAMLALGHGTLAYELTPELTTLRRVDIAGQYRGLTAFPKHDLVTGELHLLATAATGAQSYVVVSAGALTRRSRPIAGGPNGLTDLALTDDRVVFTADGFVGVALRHSEAAINWIATGTMAPQLVHVQDAGESVIALAITPSLERWALHPASGAMHCEVLDPTPWRSALIGLRLGRSPQFVWSTGDNIISKHDLDTAGFTSHTFQPQQTPSGFAFVADPARANETDGGWLIGFVHQESGDETDLIVLDAADMARPAIATIRIPRHFPRGLHSTWIPCPQPNSNQGDTP